MQRCILVAFFSLLPGLPRCAGHGPSAGDDADLTPLSLVAFNQILDPSAPTSEQDDYASDDEAAIVAERDHLRAQLAHKDKEYIDQYRAVQRFMALYKQEQQKEARLSRLLHETRAKLSFFDHYFGNLAKMRGMLDRAVETAAATPLEGDDDPDLDNEIEQAISMGAISPTMPASDSATPTAFKKRLRHHGKLGNSIPPGHAGPGLPAQQSAVTGVLSLDSLMQEEDEQIQLIEQANDEG